MMEKTKKGTRRDPNKEISRIKTINYDTLPSTLINALTTSRGGPVVDENGRSRYGIKFGADPVQAEPEEEFVLDDLERALIRATRRLEKDKRALVAAFAEAVYEPPLPVKAPEYYKDRQVIPELGRKENPVEFILRIYPIVKTQPVTQNKIKELDPQLYQGLQNWLRHNTMPTGINLPTLSTWYDNAIFPILRSLGSPRHFTKQIFSFAGAMMQRAPK